MDISESRRSDSISQFFGDVQQASLEHTALVHAAAPLVTHNGERPDQQDKTGFLLVIADHHGEAAGGDDLLTGRLQRRFTLQMGFRAGADNAYIQRVHDDNRDQQRKQLVDKFG